jgi:DNA-binding MarR family transcriptional regulator
MSARHRASPKRNVASEGSPTSDPIDDVPDDASQPVLRTVTLSGHEIRAAAQLLNVLVGVEVDRGGELTRFVEKCRVSSSHLDYQLLVEQARTTLAKRTQRSQFFSSFMFGEAAWDMLLALYVTDRSGSRHTVSGLVDLAGVPPTTALRWLDYLEQERLVSRQPNPTDRRVHFVALTQKALEALNAYFAETTPTTE